MRSLADSIVHVIAFVIPGARCRTVVEGPIMVQPVLHDWNNKGDVMCYPVWGVVHIKYPLLLNKE